MRPRCACRSRALPGRFASPLAMRGAAATVRGERGSANWADPERRARPRKSRARPRREAVERQGVVTGTGGRGARRAAYRLTAAASRGDAAGRPTPLRRRRRGRAAREDFAPDPRPMSDPRPGRLPARPDGRDAASPEWAAWQTRRRGRRRVVGCRLGRSPSSTPTMSYLSWSGATPRRRASPLACI